ncbi:FtsX-like permease family protein [Streptomyces sp. NPDC026673]|uniref:ABC transporter permease n=1 Tax=Streptomyces sp. NPDC026673 TaxID=3155724 RepID=UPI0033D515D8
MFRTALRNVLAHKARLLMTVLAVMLGVSFVSGTLVFTDTIGDAFRKASAKSYADVSVAVTPGDTDHPLPQRLLDEIDRLPGAESTTATVTGFTAVADKKGRLVGDGWSTRGGNYAGEDRYPIHEGRPPRSSSEVALDSRTAERTGYTVGDTVRMSVDGPVMEQKVTGVFTTDDGNVAAGGSLVLFDTATAQKLFAKPGTYDEIDVKAAPGTTESALRAEVEKLLPRHAEDASATTGGKLADQEARQIADDLGSFNTTLLTFAGIALFVGIFIIANTFTMLVAQRTKELALLRAVGASRRQVTRSVLVEALVVGVVAGFTGFLLGIGIAAVMRTVLASTGATLPDGSLVVQPGTAGAALAVGVGVTVLAAWLPARRAAKIPPVAAMGSVHAPATVKGLVLRNTLGALLSASGIALVLVGSGLKENGNTVLGGGAALLLVGVFVLTPLLSRPVIAAAGPLLRPLGVTGKLARQNAVRNPRRTAATASALMIGLTLITALTVVATSVKSTVDELAAAHLKSDYQISMATYQELSPEVAEQVAALDGVTVSSALRNARTELGGETEWITGVDAPQIGRLLSLDFVHGSLAAVHGESVVVDTDTAKRRGWHAGQSVPVRYADGTKGRLTIGGVYEGGDLINGVIVDNATVTPHTPKAGDMRVLVKMAGGADEANRDALVKALGGNPVVKVQDKADTSREISSTIDLMLNILYGLLAMAVLVAVLGVVNTLAMSVFERKHEIGMLRAIGLDRSAVKRMIRLESLVISLFGAVLGIGLGVFLAWAVGGLIRADLSSYALVLPWDRIGVFLAIAAVVGVLAALWPARRAARLHMLESIKAE